MSGAEVLDVGRDAIWLTIQLCAPVLIVGLVVVFSPWRLGPVVEPVLLVVGTVGLCWGTTAVVQRVGWLRPLFGLARTMRA